MPKDVHKKKVEQAVAARIDEIYKTLADKKGWAECPVCNGRRQVLDDKNKIARCEQCRGIGYGPPLTDA